MTTFDAVGGWFRPPEGNKGCGRKKRGCPFVQLKSGSHTVTAFMMAQDKGGRNSLSPSLGDKDKLGFTGWNTNTQEDRSLKSVPGQMHGTKEPKLDEA